MIFTKKNAGKWVASKGGKVIAVTGALPDLMKKVEKRKDREALRYDLVPPAHFVGSRGVPLR